MSNNFYPKYDPLNTIEFFDCYNKLDGYFLNDSTQFFEPCYKTCKSCKERGDIYDHKCTECKRGYKFEDDTYLSCVIDPDYDGDEEEKIADENWFKLGNEKFSYYQLDKCFMIFYEKKIFLISNKKECELICPDWVDNINDSTCFLRKYNNTFRNMNRQDYIRLLEDANVYEEIKDNVNLIINRNEEKKIIYHLTNFVTESPNYLSSIHLNEKIKEKILNFYNITTTKNLLVMKADIKRDNIQSKQVEYQFYNPELINQKIDISLVMKRRLNGEEDLTPIISIDVPVEWTEEQKSKIDELSRNGIDAFNSSNPFYLDGCNQYTTDENKDLFLEDRKKDYYPDIELCEDKCVFVKYNNESGKVTCDCNYKSSTDNYDSVGFAKKEVDDEFNKKNYLENLKSMKCLEKIFEVENLKKNPGFFVMIIFLIIFMFATILYFFFYGFHSVEDLIEAQFDDEKLTIFLKGNIEKEKNLYKSDEDDKKIKYEEKDEKPKIGLKPEIAKDGINQAQQLDINKFSKINNTKTDSLDIQGSKNSKIDLKNSIDSKSERKDEDVQSEKKEDDKNEKSKKNAKSRQKNTNLIDNNTNSSEALKGQEEIPKEKSIDYKDIKQQISKEDSIDGGIEFGNGGDLIDKPNDENEDLDFNPGTLIKIEPNSEKKIDKQGKDLFSGQLKSSKENDDDSDLEYDQSHPTSKKVDEQKPNVDDNEDDKDMEYKVEDTSQSKSKQDDLIIDDVSYQGENVDEEKKSDDKLTNSSMSGRQKIDYSLDSGTESHIANPPKNTSTVRQIRSEEKRIYASERYSESERLPIKVNNNKKVRKLKICQCFNRSSGEKRFMSIYIDGLKKHHIIFYTFFNWFDKNNMSLKLSFFSFSLHLYFGLNTILIFDLSVSDSFLSCWLRSLSC